MLRLSVMSLSYQRAFRAGQMDFLSYIDECRALDLDGVDLHGRHFASEDTDYLWQIKKACVRRGLTIACVSIPNNYALPAEQLPAEMAKTRKLIDSAAYLGAPLVRVFAGWSDQRDDKTWQLVRDCLGDAAEYGQRRGIVVALQNHNHHGVASTGQEVLRMMAEVNHANLRHVMDSGQYPDLYESMKLTAEHAVHVRCKIYQIDSGKEERLDYHRIFAILRHVKYNGFLSIVYEGQGDEKADVAKAVPFLRRLMVAVQ